MSRLYRPHIPLEVRVRVALRQLGEIWIDDWIEAKRDSGMGFGAMLAELLDELRLVLHAEKLHLDHDPPLGARLKTTDSDGNPGYIPEANDPEFLIYREVTAHGIKTRVRGEHGQFSDLALIKRARRRERPKKKRHFSFGVNKSSKKMKRPKTRWVSRPFQKRKK